MVYPILKNIKELEQQTRQGSIVVMILLMLSILSLLVSEVGLTMIIALFTILSFVSLRHIENRKHSNYQFEEIYFKLNELQKDTATLKLKYRKEEFKK